jgi:hypothetical protein
MCSSVRFPSETDFCFSYTYIEYLKQLPRSYLYFGYTTLVDLAVVEHRVLDEFRQAPLHPDLYDCGQSLPIANGYPACRPL